MKVKGIRSHTHAAGELLWTECHGHELEGTFFPALHTESGLVVEGFGEFVLIFHPLHLVHHDRRVLEGLEVENEAVLHSAGGRFLNVVHASELIHFYHYCVKN